MWLDHIWSEKFQLQNSLSGWKIITEQFWLQQRGGFEW